MGRMFNPPHPGEILREFLPDGMTIEQAAKRLGASRGQLSHLLNGRSAITAIRIGLLTGTTDFMAERTAPPLKDKPSNCRRPEHRV